MDQYDMMRDPVKAAHWRAEASSGRPRLDLYPELSLPDSTRPEWRDVERMAIHLPAANDAVTLVQRGDLTREEALVQLVYRMYASWRTQLYREVDRRNTEVPDFIMVDGKRYDRSV